MELSLIKSKEEWNRNLLRLPGHHLLQSWEWGELKSKYGWHADRLIWQDRAGLPVAAAQILHRNIGRLFHMAYSPRGPVLAWSEGGLRDQVLQELAAQASKRNAIFLKIDPAILLDDDPQTINNFHTLKSVLEADGWRGSPEQVQFRNTFTLDLRPSEDELLAKMKQKTRYNVRLAGRRGVSVRFGGMDDLALLYRMYAETALRDGFVIRTQAYYEDAWWSFMSAEMAQPLIAEVEGNAVAALIVFRFGDTAYYLYGMSTERDREKMPNYILQWEAIRWAKNLGCRTYDFWGAPDRIEPEDRLYGVYRFKQGFGARFIQTPGAWDLPLKPTLYTLYTKTMPAVLSFMRAGGRARVRSEVKGNAYDQN